MTKNVVLALCLAVASAAPALRGMPRTVNGSARKVEVHGYLVDVPSFEGGVYDPRTHDVKAACPDAAACAYGVVVGNELHRLDDAGNDAVAAAVAGAGPETNWFVKISGERGADGHVAIGAGMNAPARHRRDICHCGPCKEEFVPCDDGCQGSPCAPGDPIDDFKPIFFCPGGGAETWPDCWYENEEDLGLTAAEESTTKDATTKSGGRG